MVLDYDDKKLIMDKVVDMLLIPYFLSTGRSATGNWVNSVYGTDTSVYAPDYTRQLDDGRAPGMPPVGPELKAYVAARFGPDPGDRIAWAIAMKIKKEGFEGGAGIIDFLKSDEVTSFIEEEYKTMIFNKLLKKYR